MMSRKPVELTDLEQQAIAELKKRLVVQLSDRLKEMVLFGSKARGDWGPDSDVDVAIIVHGPLQPSEKFEILQTVAEVEVQFIQPLATLVLSTDELQRLRDLERRIALDIEQEGVPL
jgi:uncharacterized protein